MFLDPPRQCAEVGADETAVACIIVGECVLKQDYLCVIVIVRGDNVIH